MLPARWRHYMAPRGRMLNLSRQHLHSAIIVELYIDAQYRGVVLRQAAFLRVDYCVGGQLGEGGGGGGRGVGGGGANYAHGRKYAD